MALDADTTDSSLGKRAREIDTVDFDREPIRSSSASRTADPPARA